MQGDWCHRRAYSPERRHPGNRIHGGDGDEARFGKWLHIQPQGAEVMRVPYRRQRNTVLRRAFHQEGSGRGKRGLREAVAGVHAQKTASHRVDDGFRMAVDIPAFERVDVSRNAKEAVATGAVAVGTGDRVGQNVRHCSRCAVFSKIEASSIFKSSNAMVLLSVSLPGFAVIRYPRLRCLVDAVLRSSSNARRFPAIRPSLHADPGMDGYRPGVQGTLP